MTDSRKHILVFSDGEPMLFTGVQAAEAYMEPEDVEAGCYEAYDSYGCRLQIRVGKANVRGLLGLGEVCVDAVNIDPCRGEKDDSAALTLRIVSFLKKYRQNVPPVESFGEALALLEREVGLTR